MPGLEINFTRGKYPIRKKKKKNGGKSPPHFLEMKLMSSLVEINFIRGKSPIRNKWREKHTSIGNKLDVLNETKKCRTGNKFSGGNKCPKKGENVKTLPEGKCH